MKNTLLYRVTEKSITIGENRRGAAFSKGLWRWNSGDTSFRFMFSWDTFAKIWPKFSERSKIEIVTGEHDIERGGTNYRLRRERIQGGELFDVAAQRLRTAFDDEIQGIPPFALCSPDTFAKIWPKFSERSKIEIVTGEHDVERGGARLASSEGLRQWNSGRTSFRFMFSWYIC